MNPAKAAQVDIEDKGMPLIIPLADLAALLKCVDVTLSVMEDWEFLARVGCDRDEMSALSVKLHSAIESFIKNA